jgi:hypothetical protein
VAVALFLRAYLQSGADTAELLSGAHDPKDFVLFGMHVLNPFTWLYGGVALIVVVGPFFSALLATASLPALALARSRVSSRTWRWLLAATVTGIALVVATLTPFSAMLGIWLADRS